MRTDTIARQIERPCSFDQFLIALGHDATDQAGPSAMMATAASPFWIGIVHTMRDQQERIGKSCLVVAIAIFVMIVGRVAWTYLAVPF